MDKKNVIKKLEKFYCEDAYTGIMLLITENTRYDENNLYCAISFGSGCNIADKSKHDGTINIDIFNYDGSTFDEYDGGELDYLEEIEKYGDDIRNAVADALEFMFDEIPEFIPLHTFES